MQVTFSSKAAYIFGQEPDDSFNPLQSNLTAVSADTAVTGTLNTMPLMQYVSSSVTASSAVAYAYMPFQADINGFLKSREQYAPVAEDNVNGVIAMLRRLLATNTYAPLLSTNFAAATKANVKASAGNVFAVYATNLAGTPCYFQLHNKASAPSAGETPLYSFWVPMSGTVELGENYFCGSGGYFTTGIGWAWSTTPATFTDGTLAIDHNVNIHYK